MREHAPPPVQIELGRGRMGMLLVSALATAAAAAVAAWSAQPLSWLGLPVAATLAARLSRPARGLLCWDGTLWRWRTAGAEQSGHAQLMMDLGDALVLRFVPLGGEPACWWWLGRREAGGAWHGLRVALVQQRAGRPSAA